MTVYVNGEKIKDQYKPIIVNDRTLVRLVPIFDQLGYTHNYNDVTKTVRFNQKGSNAAYTFKAESKTAVIGTGAVDKNGELMAGEGDVYKLEVSATLKYFDTFYVPLRSFCNMLHLDIEWDNTKRSVYVGTK